MVCPVGDEMDLFSVYDGCITKINLRRFFNLRKTTTTTTRTIARVIPPAAAPPAINDKSLESSAK